MNPRIHTANSVAFTCGSMICKKMRQFPAPSIFAASA